MISKNNISKKAGNFIAGLFLYLCNTFFQNLNNKNKL